MPVYTRSSNISLEVCEKSNSSQLSESVGSESNVVSHVEQVISPGSSTEEIEVIYCCDRCRALDLEVKNLKSVVSELKGEISLLKTPANLQSSVSKDAIEMQMSYLEKNNDALILAVQALSSQLLDKKPIQEPPKQVVAPDLEFICEKQVTEVIPAVEASSIEVQRKPDTKKHKQRKKNNNQAAASNITEPDLEREKTTLIIGDSMVSRIQGKDLGKAVGHKVVVKSFSGATTSAMSHYLKPNLELSPSEVVLHVATNDLKTRDPKDVADSVVDLARQIETTCSASVAISEIVCRKDTVLDQAAKAVNKHLKKYCNQNGWDLIQHQNISYDGLNKGGLHLNFKGNEQFYRNFKTYLE